jgi:hypothetical protein
MTSGHALGVEAKLGGSYKQESEPNDDEKQPDPALENKDLDLEILKAVRRTSCDELSGPGEW